MKRTVFILSIIGNIFIFSLVVAADGTSAESDKTSTSHSNLISAYAKFTSAVEQSLLTVPPDKHFVLTDIIGQASIEINQGKETKLKVQIGYSPVNSSENYQSFINLKTGIVFAPGTSVIVYPFPVGTGKQSSYGYVTLLGYFY